MDNNALILQQTSAFVKKDFEIDYIPEDVTEEELLTFLREYIYDLIDKDMKQLFYILYRLDINEQKVHKALNPLSKEAPHEVLALLIFEREKQKAKTRIEYSNYDQEDDCEAW
jgi:hypothetical protein